MATEGVFMYGHRAWFQWWLSFGLIPFQCDTDPLHCRLTEARLLQLAGQRLPRPSTLDPAVSEAAAR